MRIKKYSTIFSLKAIPFPIKQACLSLSLFTLGWGIGTDTYLSLYTEQLVDNLFVVGLLFALLAAIKVPLNIPIAEIDSAIDQKKMIISGKIIYALACLCALLAGLWQSVGFLILYFIGCGIASPMVYTTYQCYIRERSSQANACQVFGLYNAALAITYCGGALLTALIIPYFELHWFYVFPVALAFLTIPQDLKLPRNHRQSFFKILKRALFHKNVYRQALNDIKKYRNSYLYFILFVQFLWGLLDYVSFFFIPLLALEHQLSLPQIALIFGLARMPFVLSFFFAEMADKQGRMSMMGGSFIILACLLGILGFSKGFGVLILTSTAASLCMAIIRPTADGVLTNLIMPKQRSEITGIQEFLSKGGQIIGSLLFGLLAELIGLELSFSLIGLVSFITGILTFAMYHRYRKRGILARMKTFWRRLLHRKQTQWHAQHIKH